MGTETWGSEPKHPIIYPSVRWLADDSNPAMSQVNEVSTKLVTPTCVIAGYHIDLVGTFDPAHEHDR